MKWHNEKRKISDLIPMKNNPRKMTSKQVQDLKTSLAKFDLVEIPAVNLDNQILAGHQRIKIMAMLGRGGEIVDVRVPDRLLTKAEADEYCIRSNKNTGEFDFDILANEFELSDLVDWGFDEKDFQIDLDGDGDEEDEDRKESKPMICPRCGLEFKKGREV